MSLHLRRSNAALQAEIGICEQYIISRLDLQTQSEAFETASRMEMATVRIYIIYVYIYIAYICI